MHIFLYIKKLTDKNHFLYHYFNFVINKHIKKYRLFELIEQIQKAIPQIIKKNLYIIKHIIYYKTIKNQIIFKCKLHEVRERESHIQTHICIAKNILIVFKKLITNIAQNIALEY